MIPLGVVAKLDLIEAKGELATPVDYKKGKPKRRADGRLTAWDPERIRICLRAIVLRENGFRCDEGVLYFQSTRQRVRVPIDGDLIRLTEAINNRMVYPEHFVEAERGVSLTESGPKPLFRAYEQRTNQLVTHPLFDYRVSYRRLLEIQTRLHARGVAKELDRCPVFVTRHSTPVIRWSTVTRRIRSG